MGEILEINQSRFGSLRANRNLSGAIWGRFATPGPRSRSAPIPQARTTPSLSAIIPDEVLEQYAFIFCQGGFRGLGMTFEQFLLVAEAVKPRCVSYEDAA